jgi:hypothetical protein
MSKPASANAWSIAAATLLLGACTVAPPPEQQSAAAQKADEHTQLRDAINTPIDKAKAANDPNVQHDQEQAKALDDQGG